MSRDYVEVEEVSSEPQIFSGQFASGVLVERWHIDWSPARTRKGTLRRPTTAAPCCGAVEVSALFHVRRSSWCLSQSSNTGPRHFSDDMRCREPPTLNMYRNGRGEACRRPGRVGGEQPGKRRSGRLDKKNWQDFGGSGQGASRESGTKDAGPKLVSLMDPLIACLALLARLPAAHLGTWAVARSPAQLDQPNQPARSISHGPIRAIIGSVAPSRLAVICSQCPLPHPCFCSQ